MSFYKKNNFILTDHFIVRVKQRIKHFNNLDIIQIKQKINFILETTAPEFYNKKNSYYKFPYGNYMYIVINNNDNVAITITQISYHKKLELTNEW